MKKIIISLFLGTAFFVFMLGYLKKDLAPNPPPTSPNTVGASKCLSANEYVEYAESYSEDDNIYRLNVFIKDRASNEIISSFEILNIADKESDHRQPRDCHIYVLKEFGYDYKRKRLVEGQYRRSAWLYDYSGQGMELMYSVPIFRVDETETYIAYEEYNTSHPDYALVIKNIKTGEIVFSIKLMDLVEQYGVEPGAFNLESWGEKRLSQENLFTFSLINTNRTTIGVDIAKREIYVVND